MTPEPRDWYCPACKRFVASEDLTSPLAAKPKHLDCKTVVERRVLVISTNDGTNEPPKAG